jgi:hypothetical protein
MIELISQPDLYVGSKTCPKVCFAYGFSAVRPSALIIFANLEPNVFGEMLTIAGVKLEVGTDCDLTSNLAATNAQALVDALNSNPEFFTRANARVVATTQVLLEAYNVGFDANWLFDVSDLSFPPTVTSNAGSDSDAPDGYRFHYQFFTSNLPYGALYNIPMLYNNGIAQNQCFELKLDLVPSLPTTGNTPVFDQPSFLPSFMRYGDSQKAIPCGTAFNKFENTEIFNIVQGAFVDWGTENVEFLTRRERPIKICNDTYESLWIILNFGLTEVTDLFVQYTFFDVEGGFTAQTRPFTLSNTGVYQVPIGKTILWPSSAVRMEVQVIGNIGGSDEVLSETFPVIKNCIGCKCFPIWYMDGGWSQMIFETLDEAEWVDEHETLEIAVECDTCKNRKARLELKENFIVSTTGNNLEEFKRSMGVFLNSPKHYIYEYGQFKEVFLRPGSTNFYLKDRLYRINLRFDK